MSEPSRWLCGCPARGRVPNRADKRRARRLGMPEPAAVKEHLHDCPNQGSHITGTPRRDTTPPGAA